MNYDLILINNNNLILGGNGYNPLILDLLSFLAILSAILVISTTNPVISVLFLISLFINIAIYLVILGITFIGLTYIVVYVGAVTILFLFVIMLLNIKVSEIYKNTNNNLPYGAILGISFIYPILYAIPDNIRIIHTDTMNLFYFINIWLTGFSNYNNSSFISESNDYVNFTQYTNNINLDKALSDLWDNSIYGYTHVSSIGHNMYSSHIIWFLIVSLILLLAMVGAISLTLKIKN